MKYSNEILTIRLIHIISVLMLYFSMAVLIYFGINKELNSLTIFAIMFLMLEGALVGVMRDRPLSKVHKKFGDDKIFFDLFLPEKYQESAFMVSLAIGILSVIFYVSRII